jgi:phage gp45-like
MMDLRRFEFDGRMEEKGGQQFVSGRGLFGDGFTRIHRPEPHGFMSNPVKGAKGLVVAPYPDLAFILGLESPGLRPAGLPEGVSALYDANGNIIKMLMGDGISIDVAGSAFTLSKGGVTMTVSAAGVDITGGYLKVNGVRVDETHVHGGVISGGDNTDVPVG